MEMTIQEYIWLIRALETAMNEDVEYISGDILSVFIDMGIVEEGTIDTAAVEQLCNKVREKMRACIKKGLMD